MSLKIVGAGPGDPELLTIAGARAIMAAEVIVADYLVSDEIIDLRAPGTVVFQAPKARRHDQGQAKISAAVRSALEQGKRVVRLKGGDPSVFARLPEETSGEVIPGISSVLAAPAAIGVPLTKRGVADRFMVLTLQGRGGRTPDLPKFDPTTTYVFLMGAARWSEALESLVSEAGFPPRLPVAAVSSATLPSQEIVGPLPLSEAANLDPPKAPLTIIAGWAVSQGPPPSNRKAAAALTSRPDTT